MSDTVRCRVRHFVRVGFDRNSELGSVDRRRRTPDSRTQRSDVHAPDRFRDRSRGRSAARPITAVFDEQGRLYVIDSSGSNDKVEKQLAERPHRIVRLSDTNGDGRFDDQTVFADKMSFPEGSLRCDGSLYVTTLPSIWKLTGADTVYFTTRRLLALRATQSSTPAGQSVPTCRRSAVQSCPEGLYQDRCRFFTVLPFDSPYCPRACAAPSFGDHFACRNRSACWRID